MEILKRNEREIEELPLPARYAFAARLAERALNEIEAAGGELPNNRSLHGAVELLWRQAIHGDVEYERDARAIHEEVTKSVPVSVDDPWPKLSVRALARVLGCGMIAIHKPQNSGRKIAEVGEAIWGVLVAFHPKEDEDRIIDLENEWQDRAIAMLAERGEQPITRDMFDEIPEYDRGPRIEEKEFDPEE